jgi:hypothetical protein
VTVDTTKATFSFFAHARSGVGGTLSAQFAATLTPRPSLALSLDLDAGDSAQASVTVLGPGDVVAIDPAEIVRSDPPAGALNWTPNWFPLVEFDRPDLPWLFSPYGPSGDRLRPWLVLAVVEIGDGMEYTDVHPQSGRPALRVSGKATANEPRTLPDRELPDLNDSWAWAHVTVSGNVSGTQLEAENRDHPERVVSRIIGPRRLHPGRRYRACLVPAFKVGVEAGMGAPAQAGTLAPAWEAGDETVELPVYFSWEFGTGAEGDFEALARRLEPTKAAPAAGTGPVDFTAPGGGLPPAGAQVTGMHGALKPPGADFGPGPVPAFQSALRALLNAGAPAAGAAPRPLEMPPPIYGGWPAGRATLPSTLPLWSAAWLNELNLDPRNRAAAALGTEIVRREQEELMASAWAQVGPIDRANEALRQAQLAREAATAAHARLAALPATAIVTVAAPALSRITSSAGNDTLRKTVRGTRMAPALSSALRKALRPRGGLARRSDPGGRLRGAMARLNSDATAAVPARAAPDGTHMASWIASADDAAVAAADPGNYQPRDDGVSPRNGSELQQGAYTHQQQLENWSGKADPIAPALDLSTTAARVVDQLRPAVALTARVTRRVAPPAGRGGTRADPLEPIMDAPEFDAPMWESLRRLGQENIVRGIDDLPDESITVLATNDRFVNSFMVGLNHEMSRELLWREYPTDQRGTYFRFFWDSRARVGGPASQGDIDPLHQWPLTRSLDYSSNPAGSGRLVLVLKGELLRRFPNATISAIEATSGTPRGLGTNEIFPVFSGRLDPDVTFVGFDLSEQGARTGGSQGAGWFFVVQEHPGEPHLGLEEAVASTVNVPGGKPSSWGELSWAHLVATQADLDALSYAPAIPPSSATPTTAPPAGDPVWGTHSADVASIALRKPVRLAIHATDLLPGP